MATTTQSDIPSLDRKPHPGRRMTWEEFHDWLDDTTRAEWVNGEVTLMPPATNPHQTQISFFDVLMTLYVSKTGAGEVRTGPYQVKLSQSSREPDVMFIATENRGRIQRTYLDGPPDIAIEILSPSTRRTDQNAKRREYEADGVREYWMLDPDKQTANFLRLGADGKYFVVPLEDGVFRSEVLPGFWFKVEWLWNAPLARIHEIAREIGAI